MDRPAQFRLDYPDIIFLDPEQPHALEAYLKASSVIDAADTLRSVSKAGDGNMNCTVRALTAKRSLIIKQSRPWVEKYPQFEAPWDRILREMDYFEITARSPELIQWHVEVLHAAPRHRLMVFQDAGEAGDYADIYQGGRFDASTIDSLAAYLSRLHCHFHGERAVRSLKNLEMRALNHAHIFEIPLQKDNGLDLDTVLPGLAEVAPPLKEDPTFVATVHRLGRERYLAEGPCLQHGDFFPGSFLRTDDGGLRVIDAEFCYGGLPEWDAAVLLAHLHLAKQPPALAERFLTAYERPRHFDDTIMWQLSGVEIMRRIIGYAQLPLAASLEERRDMLDTARQLVVDPRQPLG